MSFLSIIKNIGTAVLTVGGPIASALYPPAAPWIAKLDNLVQAVQGSVIQTEATVTAAGQGPIKSDLVNGDINTYIDTMNAGLAFENKQIVDDAALRQATINASVAFYNAAAQWKASFKVVDLPKA